eukprot:Em0004g1571a
MECPTCQRSITIPEGGVNAIPQNLHLGFEVEVAGYMSKIGSDGEKSCDACIDGSTWPAVVFCCTCQELRTQDCALVLHKDHRIDEMVHRQAIKENRLRIPERILHGSYTKPLNSSIEPSRTLLLEMEAISFSMQDNNADPPEGTVDEDAR